MVHFTARTGPPKMPVLVDSSFTRAVCGRRGARHAVNFWDRGGGLQAKDVDRLILLVALGAIAALSQIGHERERPIGQPAEALEGAVPRLAGLGPGEVVGAPPPRDRPRASPKFPDPQP